MADATALVRAGTNTGKIASALKSQWEVRTKTRSTLNDGTAMDMVMRAQIDEIFLVLAHLGEAILPLGIFNKDYYLQTLGEVQASINSCGHELLPMAWAELNAELQYACTAGFTICACYSPMPVYRGFGACVLGDWDWGCPDMKHLEEKAQKKAIRTIYGFKQKVDPQPTKAVFVAFDHVIQILQVKAMAFLSKRPVLSSFSDHEPRYGGWPKKEVKHDLELFEDWVKQLERRGHPAPKGAKLSSWGIPFATWTSPHSCHILKREKDCETIMCNQMDPGRLLHSFVCRGALNLEQGQVLLLPPRSPAESLVCWLEGLPNTSHKTVKWEDFDTERFETKISKSLRKKIGRYPLPSQYAIRHPEAASGSALSQAASTPRVLEHPNTVLPPPYSDSKAPSAHAPSTPVAELGTAEVRELPASSVSSSPKPHHASSLPVPEVESSGLKSIHTLRRKTTGGTSNTSSTQITTHPAASAKNAQELAAEPQDVKASAAVELPEDTARSKASGTALAAVELPTDYQSEAPKGLPPATRLAELPSSNEGSKMEDTSDPMSDSDTPTVISEEPESIADPSTDSETKTGGASSDANAGNQYLELLNKVAKGEISPQALSQILAEGELSPTSERPPNSTTITEEKALKLDSARSKTTQSMSSSLPYPLSPTERKPNEEIAQNKFTIGPPYPSSPTEASKDTKQVPEATKNDVPASLKPSKE